MSKHPSDLRALGARALSTRALVQQLIGKDAVDVDDAVAALGLHHRAREAALLDLRSGPRLLAAVELGRRAWLSSPPLGARVLSPAEAAAVAAPRLVDDDRALVVSLDVRGRVARLECVDDDVGLLQSVLKAGCARAVVVRRKASAAVPDRLDVEALVAVRARGAAVGVDVLDGVLLGDDGFCSMLRLGLIGPRLDRRYG